MLVSRKLYSAVCVMLMIVAAFAAAVPAMFAMAPPGGGGRGPDLQIDNIWWEDAYGTIGDTNPSLTSGQPFSVWATVKNYGNRPATSFHTGLYIDSGWEGTAYCAGLDPGYSVDLEWPALFESSVQSHSARVVADYYDSQSERSETNNERIESFNINTAQWTFAVYLDADNNLESAGINDFVEMAEYGSSPALNIVVMMDRIAGFDTGYGDWTTTEKFFVRPGSRPYTSQAYEHCGEVNMGDPNVLIAFANDAFDRFESNRQILVLWDHGGGWIYGVCDDWTDDDFITTGELRTSLLSISSHMFKDIDIIGFDACLMGMTEIMYDCNGAVAEFVGSEESVPNDGWPYDDIIQLLRSNPGMTSWNLASTIVDEYVQSYSGGSQGTDPSVTLSAFHMEFVVPDVTDELRAFSNELISHLALYESEIAEARQNTDEFSVNDYADLYHFASNVFVGVPDTSVRDAAASLMDSITSAVINEGHGANHWPCEGMSIYWPEIEYSMDYDNQRLSSDNTWDDFLRAYHDVGGPGYAFEEDFEDGPSSISDWTTVVNGNGVLEVVADPASESLYSLHISGGGSTSTTRATSPAITEWDSYYDYAVTFKYYVTNSKWLVVYDDSRVVIEGRLADGLEAHLYAQIPYDPYWVDLGAVTHNAWHTIEIVVSVYAPAAYAVYIDGELRGEGISLLNSAPGYNTFTVGSRDPPGSKDTWNAYWDDICIEEW